MNFQDFNSTFMKSTVRIVVLLLFIASTLAIPAVGFLAIAGYLTQTEIANSSIVILVGFLISLGLHALMEDIG